MDARLVKVDFKAMLNSDCLIVCEHWLLSNSINKYGIDFKVPMTLNDFLMKIGEVLTGMNCKSLLQHAEWYIYTCDSEEIIDKYFRKVLPKAIDRQHKLNEVEADTGLG